MRFAACGLYASRADAQAARADTLSAVDLYGLRNVSEAAVRSAVRTRAGEAVPSDIEAIRARLRAIPGVSDAELATVCCADDGGSLLYIGIREAGTAAITHRNAPTGSARLPAHIAQLGEAYTAALMNAVQRGVAGEDRSRGYALSQDSVMRAIQQQFITIATQDMDTLQAVLRVSADADERALAAQILAYGTDQRAIAREPLFATDDPDETVRNNAVRAISILALWANDHPDAGVSIPAAPFIDLLNSVSWSDRNKGVLAVMALTATRNPDVLRDVRTRALSSLVEMARWTNSGHALAPWIILARLAGIDDGEAFQAWQAGRREDIIQRAVTAH